MILKSMIQMTLKRCNETWQPNFNQPIKKSFKGLLIRVIRKIIRPVLGEPIKLQEEFNVNAVRTMNQMYEKILELENKVKELEAR